MHVCGFGYSHTSFQKHCFLEQQRLFVISPHTIIVTTLHSCVWRKVKTGKQKILGWQLEFVLQGGFQA